MFLHKTAVRGDGVAPQRDFNSLEVAVCGRRWWFLRQLHQRAPKMRWSITLPGDRWLSVDFGLRACVAEGAGGEAAMLVE